ncbi:MAG: 16S rRNA (guanine(966)-N(2))-methyltransferase RsmD [Methylophilaceae bacterium]|nr:16S rRNA (guanine(966)-N(2))-methyltransferase RsmD [Methylophilaceae bacterium]
MNRVRISAGQWRGRWLQFPDVPGLRPTPDRVRQTLFNWLGQQLHGISCLDLFAGSGALGFEALSRHADEAVLVERHPAVHRALQENAALLGADRATIMRADAFRFLAENRRKFDVIFLDPPFDEEWIERLLPILPPHLAPEGRVYVEAARPVVEREGWRLVKQGKAGGVHYHLLECSDEHQGSLSRHL